ncbi:MAG: ATP-binding protein [Algoriphagus sp.]|nr:ATP-binding protein [Algoriphagus sp.]
MTPEENQITFILFAGAFLAALMGVFVVAMVVLHRQRQIQNRQKLDQIKTEHEKTLLNIENEIQQETLSHIGRELHDNIGQLLSLAKLNFGSAKPEKQSEGKVILNQIIKEVRGLSKTLNIDWVESISLDDFFNQELGKIQATGFCKTSLENNLEDFDLTKDQKLVLIRVTQECLNNALKHASPEKIEVKIYQNGKGKVIRIIDDGKGFDQTVQSTGSGMTNLKKRMETIGGEFQLTSVVGKGTDIKLLLPI